jgi:hypothetical protein
MSANLPRNRAGAAVQAFANSYNKTLGILSSSLEATSGVLRSVDNLADSVVSIGKTRLLQLLSGAAAAAAAAPPIIASALGKFRSFVSRPATPMTAFRLYMTLDPMRHGLAYNLDQPDELRRFLDVRVLAMDKASLKLEDLATKQFALDVNQYLKTPIPIFADNVIRSFIYWRSVVNYHKVQKGVTLEGTAGIIVNAGGGGGGGGNMAGVPLFRPPSQITWGGRKISEFDTQDATVVLEILKQGSPALRAYMLAALGSKKMEEVTTDDIMRPAVWRPRLEAMNASSSTPVIQDLIKALNDIPEEARKIGKLDVAASAHQAVFMEREGLNFGGNANVGSRGNSLVNANKGPGNFPPTPYGTQTQPEESQNSVAAIAANAAEASELQEAAAELMALAKRNPASAPASASSSSSEEEAEEAQNNNGVASAASAAAQQRASNAAARQANALNGPYANGIAGQKRPRPQRKTQGGARRRLLTKKQKARKTKKTKKTIRR